jgi:hypothetical protein
MTPEGPSMSPMSSSMMMMIIIGMAVMITGGANHVRAFE